MSILAAIPAFAGCCMCGLMSAYRLGARARSLEWLLSDIHDMETCMEYNRTALSRVVTSPKSSKLAPLWAQMSAELASGTDAAKAFGAAYGRTVANPVVAALDTDEIELLSELFRDLGGSDMERQRACFKRFFERAARLEQRVSDDSARKSRVYRGVGTLGGIAFALLLV